ncbi:MAG: pgl [Pseudonocardiales bacterium]|nr:pgl [Pseudonocardiales bacterium]
MAAQPEVFIQPGADALAADVADRTRVTLAKAQKERGFAALVVTGGSILEKVFQALAEDGSGVDWSKVDLYWGDERFVAADSDDRNDLPLERLLIDQLPFDPARVFRMPSTDGPDGDDVAAAAQRYAAILAGQAAAHHGQDDQVPAFDVVLLGMGPDGHCCSLFPDQPGTRELVLTVIGVHDSPKPPPTRISLSFRALAAAEEIWVIASGEGKCEAVAKALGGADRVKIPVAGAQGQRRTLWLLDSAAANQLPT